MPKYPTIIQKHEPVLDNILSPIPETRFFRDPKIFEKLTGKLFSDLLENKNQQTALRIWVAGCSTGEEVYSILICLHELLGKRVGEIKIQVFGTDISEKAIAKARSGLYQKSELNGVSGKRLGQFFTETKEGFQIHKIIRSSCVFASHNYLLDPPFSKIDLISCRNSLVYMSETLQKQALATFHYGLKEGGYLLLGRSETADDAGDLFKIYDKPSRVYSKNPSKSKFSIVPKERRVKIDQNGDHEPRTDDPAADFGKNADEEILTRFAPPGVIVDSAMEVVQFRGSTGRWLETPPGRPSLNMLTMAREGLSFVLKHAMLQAKATDGVYVHPAIPFRLDDEEVFLTIEVIPLKRSSEPHYLILFLENRSVQEKKIKDVRPVPEEYGASDKDIYQIRQLQMELLQAEENMRLSTNEHLAAHEELQTANEELLSGTEELQSMNEELEAAREDAASTNEELILLNQQLFDRNDHLNIMRLYAESIVATMREPLIILDKNFRVQNANPAFYSKFDETVEQVAGRNVFELGNRQWDIPRLKTLLEKILPGRTTITDFEVTHDFPLIGQRIMLLNATPVLRDDSDEQYILLVFEDVTEKRKIADQLKLFADELEIQVIERTEALRKANADLSYSNESLQQFAYIASHDLQEPLRKIKTFSNLLSGQFVNKIPGEANHLISKIVDSTERMSALIREVLEFSRVVDNNITYQLVDLNRIMEENIRDFDLSMKEKKAAISWENLPLIEGLPIQLGQLFSNLISNSLKFSHADISPVIRVNSEILTPAETALHPGLDQRLPYCKITFRDNGIGFDPEFSNQVFLIFHRLHARSRYPGTGIGLALCKKIVTNHHGEIDVATREGSGTTFHIFLPLRQS